MLSPPVIATLLSVTLLTGGAGVAVAWWLRRRTSISVRNLYLPATLSALMLALGVAAHAWVVLLVLAPLSSPWIAGALVGRRWRLADLGAGEELRNHELARRWVWEPRAALAEGERRYLRSQGELVRERSWPAEVDYVSMSARGGAGARLPVGAGQHIALYGATGAGKTTTARRLVAARTLAHHAALLIVDQKGDPEDVDAMRRLAAAARVPFILFDPQDPDSDRWQPLWGTPDGVAARAVEPIKQSEPYYYDVLRRHLDIVCKVLHAAGRWPPSVPLLVDAAAPIRYTQVLAIAKALGAEHEALKRRAKDHARYVTSTKGTEDLSGGAFRLEVALALASRQIVTPRATADGEAVAVRLLEALEQRAVVMWRTHADTMPDEAAALSVLALADLHDAAEHSSAQWTLLLDEFGAVIKMAAARAVAILQRGRSHGGQVIVITQSSADVEALTQQPGLLASLTDNFTGIVAHRQTSPESRDWLAKLMGTRALWQHTNQTAGHGTQHSGRGSARRVREFKIGSDEFAALGRGEAVIYTPLAGEPTRAHIHRITLPDDQPERIDPTGPRHPCEIAVHGEDMLSAPRARRASTRSRQPASASTQLAIDTPASPVEDHEPTDRDELASDVAPVAEHDPEQF